MRIDLLLAAVELNTAYALCIDNDELERWPDFFGDRCVYQITTDDSLRKGLDTVIVYADSKAMLVDRITALRHANIYEPHRYRHLVGMPMLRDTGNASEVGAETPFAVFRIMKGGTTTVFATGRYLDRIALVRGKPMTFVERIVVCDSSVVDTLLAIPL
jgi:3-phenylpropionate/cinnamic acid dioxygenase small subunit